MHEFKVVAKALIKRRNKILILKRSKTGKNFPSHWDLPGGTLEENEQPENALQREVFEETRLKTKPGKILTAFTLKHRGELLFITYGVHATNSDVKISAEHEQFKWATPAFIKKEKKAEPFLRDLVRKKII